MKKTQARKTAKREGSALQGCEAQIAALSARSLDALCKSCPNRGMVARTLAGQARSVAEAMRLMDALNTWVPGPCTGAHTVGISASSGEMKKRTGQEGREKRERPSSARKAQPKDRRSKRQTHAEYKRAWRLANAERHLESQRQYRSANRKRIAEYDRAYRRANRDKINARRRESRRAAAAGEATRATKPPT